MRVWEVERAWGESLEGEEALGGMSKREEKFSRCFLCSTNSSSFGNFLKDSTEFDSASQLY